MTLFLDFFWLVALILGSPFIAYKLVTTARWRVGLVERFGLRLPRPKTPERPLIWVHAVSVGEVLASRPLVAELEALLPGMEIAISTITSTGLEVARKHFPNNVSFYYPLDMTFPVKRLLNAMRPRLIVLVELELWPTFLTLARRAGVPIVVVNGRISERSYRRYQWVRRLITGPIHRFCVQTDEYAQRFLGLGVEKERVLITGNLKYDTPALAGGEEAARRMRAALGIAEGAPVLIAGSTHPSEERAVADVYRELRAAHPGLRLVVVPRHLERLAGAIADVEAAGLKVVRKTELDRGSTGTGTEAPVIVGDTMGELAQMYRVADVVFVGGSLIPHGGQNMLEPAALGKPVLFGPHVRNFRAVADELCRAGGAEMVQDAAGLRPAIGRLLADPTASRAMGEKGRAFVERHRGAARRTAEVLAEVVEPGTGTGTTTSTSPKSEIARVRI